MRCLRMRVLLLLILSTLTISSIYSLSERQVYNPIRNLDYDWDEVSITFTWTAPLNPAGLLYYKVYRDGTHIASPPGLSYTDTPSSNGWHYSITALYSGGES
ncbi:MAG: hypothetical protein P9L91_05515, partial [Candidatus Zophobacter franzmannii]|nr:hypothetical protein [Candidatus Zophobacter franzmannii]